MNTFIFLIYFSLIREQVNVAIGNILLNDIYDFVFHKGMEGFDSIKLSLNFKLISLKNGNDYEKYFMPLFISNPNFQVDYNTMVPKLTCPTLQWPEFDMSNMKVWSYPVLYNGSSWWC